MVVRGMHCFNKKRDLVPGRKIKKRREEEGAEEKFKYFINGDVGV
jgi:hypothetical protein